MKSIILALAIVGLTGSVASACAYSNSETSKEISQIIRNADSDVIAKITEILEANEVAIAIADLTCENENNIDYEALRVQVLNALKSAE